MQEEWKRGEEALLLRTDVSYEPVYFFLPNHSLKIQSDIAILIFSEADLLSWQVRVRASACKSVQHAVPGDPGCARSCPRAHDLRGMCRGCGLWAGLCSGCSAFHCSFNPGFSPLKFTLIFFFPYFLKHQ